MQVMRGSSRRINARPRRWRGAWRLRRLHVLRPRLRLLDLLGPLLRLELAVVTLAWLIMPISLLLPSFPSPMVPLRQLALRRRCTLRATTMRTSWGRWPLRGALAPLATGGS